MSKKFANPTFNGKVAMASAYLTQARDILIRCYANPGLLPRAVSKYEEAKEIVKGLASCAGSYSRAIVYRNLNRVLKEVGNELVPGMVTITKSGVEEVDDIIYGSGSIAVRPIGFLASMERAAGKKDARIENNYSKAAISLEEAAGRLDTAYHIADDLGSEELKSEVDAEKKVVGELKRRLEALVAGK